MSQRAVLPHVALITNTDLLIWDTAVLCYIEQLEGTSMRKYLLQKKGYDAEDLYQVLER